jgi:hypothetical protein
MKFSLKDGTYAHLQGIVQTRAHLIDYQKQPSDAEAELKRIAVALLPPSEWRKAPMILVHSKSSSLADLMRQKKLPLTMCVGEFTSYRPRKDRPPKAVFLYVVWLQEDFSPHMDPDVQRLFADIEWPEPDETAA